MTQIFKSTAVPKSNPEPIETLDLVEQSAIKTIASDGVENSRADRFNKSEKLDRNLPSCAAASSRISKKLQIDLQRVRDFLLCPTPEAWLEHAIAHQDILLIDHANCEKKAASTALNLIYRYTDNFDILNKMSRLAREELRHFEQVIAIMQRRGIPYRPINASRYAQELRKQVRTYEPARLVDTLICGAIIEARSCERFAALVPLLDDELADFYLSLLKSEARHFSDYLTLAHKVQEGSQTQADGNGSELLGERINVLLNAEKELIQSSDDEFRFHSGV